MNTEKKEIDLQKFFDILFSEFLEGYFLIKFRERIISEGKSCEKSYKKFFDFFNSIENLLIENAYFHLMRILEWDKSYKPQNRPLSFRMFLSNALFNLEIFKNVDPREIRKIIKSDKNWASPENNKDISELMELRHTVFAHIGKQRLKKYESIEYLFEFESRNITNITKLYNELKSRLEKYHLYIHGKKENILDEDLVEFFTENGIGEMLKRLEISLKN